MSNLMKKKKQKGGIINVHWNHFFEYFFPEDLGLVEYVLIKSEIKKESCAAMRLFQG